MKKILYSVVLVFFAGVSCSEDFTEVAPVGVLESSTFFQSESNAEEALIGLYDIMQYNYSKDWSSAFFLKQLPGDAANAGGGSSTDQTQLQDIDDYTSISISNPSIESVWSGYYKTIALANTIINEVETGTLSNKEFVLAEAKFMRAWCYFELTTMWGDVPLRLVNPTAISPEAFAIPKSTRAQIYTQVELDLVDAIAGLPDKSAVSHNFRVSKGAAQAFLGKVLVFQGRNDEAIPFLAAVIANPAHDLEPNVADIWLESTEFGVESLFELGYISTNGVDWGNVAWGGRMESNLHIQLMGPRGDGFFDLTGTGLINGWGFNLPTAKLVSAFEAAGDVDRKAATLMTEAELVAVGGSLTGTPWDYEGAFRTKYATRSSQTVSDGVAELNYTTNWRVFRYAEVLLLAAEAYNAEGQDDNARTELNKVRDRAGLDDVDATLADDALFDAIVNEKYLELAHEGQRFWDLVRWGKANEELSSAGYTSKNDLFPIPASEIDKNDALTIADQNSGY
ncbi:MULTISPECIES: RagB/SusD family nutrient uptake outer membrane protein [unclassified Algibacter]|uniref:RagB/SusD family nutrient uptake outer membrane protein n=1 Tax=unclassified Algibacter TaxID=2615009 RepID=UPI00131C248E|nr:MULTISPECIES: RagB/SusD family nutrient uptake outer membrane protein [unclassified Algibacter]MCL5130487.1 RagB/SusD family nutrient uptake outer membrane protein [Algibacter sp. L4_22]